MKYLLLLSFVVFLAACQNQSSSVKEATEPTQAELEPESEPTFLFVPNQKVGKITPSLVDKASITNLYGVANVLDTSIYIGEGQSMEGLLLFPNTENELAIITIPDDRTIFRVQQPNTAWKTPEGITIGTTLQELVEMNGKPINFYGFDWDYGGTVSNWNGGKLDSQNLLVRLRAEGTYQDLLGDQEFESTHPAVQNAVISVVEFSTYFMN